MRDGPDIAEIASLIGDPARAQMLMALADARAWTAGELAREASITAQTASAHLAKLEAAGLVRIEAQGRHRYVSLASASVSDALEALLRLAADQPKPKRKPGPRDPALRHARSCYNHLAGEVAVRLTDHFLARGWLKGSREGGWHLSQAGAKGFADAFGITVDELGSRKPLARPCLDWSERRPHLAGPLGSALLESLFEHGWVRRADGRTVTLTKRGEERIAALVGGSTR
ncbi:MAG: metalloregulator ArsR/SmtB family transcription factor [Alphaproteobacteria bacterium]|nr:metalloregulator ArsR/SmtB family transcription factor [Alphaproteobacteria bacterium]